jgi:predicted N-formylglutamate amidohydrolase
MKKIVVVITCEHGGNHIPDEFYPYFVIAKKVVSSHKGWDLGALNLAKALSSQLETPLFYSETSRLVIELNRSIGSSELFSSYMTPVAGSEVLEKYYLPYRNEVENHIDKLVKDSMVLHLSIHSFTPVWEGVERTTDIGILIDEDAPNELMLGNLWEKELRNSFHELQIDINKPYNGKDDGFTTHLRQKYQFKNYLGVELEMNQKYEHAFVTWSELIANSLQLAINKF